MPDEQAQAKSEKPTRRRLEKAREKGEVAQSREVHSALVLFMGLFSLLLFKDHMLTQWQELYRALVQSLPAFVKMEEGYTAALTVSATKIMSLLAPVMVAVFVAALIGSWGQIGLLFQTKSLVPDIKRLDPFAGLKRIFSERLLTEGFKTLLKLIGMSVIVYLNLKQAYLDGPTIMQLEAGPLVVFIAKALWRVTLHCFLFMALISVMDYAVQKHQFTKKMMMTKRDIKDELKETEGNPQVKSRIKALMKKIAGKRQMESVKEASVVVTNPQHLAIALKYGPDMKAPQVLAKGAGLIAQRIRERAHEFDIPIVENKPLARLLYRWVEIGEDIPASLYQAVAEVLAYVFQLRKQAPWGFSGTN